MHKGVSTSKVVWKKKLQSRPYRFLLLLDSSLHRDMKNHNKDFNCAQYFVPAAVVVTSQYIFNQTDWW